VLPGAISAVRLSGLCAWVHDPVRSAHKRFYILLKLTFMLVYCAIVFLISVHFEPRLMTTMMMREETTSAQSLMSFCQHLKTWFFTKTYVISKPHRVSCNLPPNCLAVLTATASLQFNDKAYLLLKHNCDRFIYWLNPAERCILCLVCWLVSQWRSQNLVVVGALEKWAMRRGVPYPRGRGTGRFPKMFEFCMWKWRVLVHFWHFFE